jgi:hypothetical protein
LVVSRRARHAPVEHETSPKTNPTLAVTKLTDWAKNPEILGGMVVVVVSATEGGVKVVGVNVVLESEVGAMLAGTLGAVAGELGPIVSPQPASTNAGTRTKPAMTNR